MVHIVGSEAVAELLRRWAGEPRVIVWLDDLRVGTVAPGLGLEEFSALRGVAGLGERDRQLRRLVGRDSLWFWFGDGVVDQLQLLQGLHFVWREGLTESPHFLVEVPGEFGVDEMAGLAAGKRRITLEMLEAGARGWELFTAGG